jgi:flagella basal body P-ring formation protein FlgA
MRCLLLLAIALLLPGAAAAETWQDLQVLRQGAAAFLSRESTSVYPDSQASVEVEAADPRLRLPRCPAPIYFLAAGSRPWGSGSVGVRCDGRSAWSLYLTYRIRLRGPALVARHPIPPRQPLAATDLVADNVEYADDPGKYPRDPSRLLGAVLTRPVAGGTPIRIDMLHRPPLVRAGQRVRILVEAPGFLVGQEGIAQHQAAAGETVRLKTAQGRIVQGTVQADGTVRVQP